MVLDVVSSVKPAPASQCPAYGFQEISYTFVNCLPHVISAQVWFVVTVYKAQEAPRQSEVPAFSEVQL